MSEWKFTDIFKPLTALFQPTTTSDNEPVGGNEPHNGDTYCKYGGVKGPPINPAIVWFKDQLKDTKRELYDDLAKAPNKKFLNMMYGEVNHRISTSEKLMKEMERVRIAGAIPIKNTVGINDGQVYIHEANKDMDNLAAKMDSDVQQIVKKHFGEKYAEELKGISIGNKVLERVRFHYLQEEKGSKYNVNADDALINNILARGSIPLNKSRSTQSIQ